MNWYRRAKLNKIASLSLNIEGYGRDYTFDDINYIGYTLNRKLFESWMDKLDNNYFTEFTTSVPGDMVVTADGLNVGDKTGVINFYTEAIQKHKIPVFVGKIVDFLSSNGVKVGKISYEKSGMFNSDVVRIPVLDNPKAEQIQDKPPEINMANDNAFFIFNNILKYNRDLWKDNLFDIRELKKRVEYYEGEKVLEEGELANEPIKAIRPESLHEFFSDYDSLSGSKARSRYDQNDVRDALRRIRELCDWAISKGYKNIYLS